MSEWTVWGIFVNPVLAPAITAWFIAQLLKVILTWFSSKRMDMSRFIGSGGMPSSHAALVMAVATAVGLGQGFHSYLFGVAMTVALVVMYDAAGVRRAAGDQARILNRLAGYIFHEEEFNQQELKELLGHKPIEVLAGALLGIATAIVLYYLA